MRGTKCNDDELSNRVQIVQDVIVPEPQNPVAFAFQERRSPLIDWIFRVLPTIRFNNETAFLAYKIYNEGADRLLAAKFRVFQLPVAEDRPKLSFCIRQLTSQLLGFSQRFARVASHALTLPPLRGSLPLPIWGEGLGTGDLPRLARFIERHEGELAFRDDGLGVAIALAGDGFGVQA